MTGRFYLFLKNISRSGLILTYYSLAPKALQLLRISLALLVIADLSIRFPDIHAHYTAEGIWPAHLAQSLGRKPGSWSLHWLYDHYNWQVFLFAVHFAAAACMLFGRFTRYTVTITWLLLVSLHNRNLFVLQAGDDLLRMVLFWCIFLPVENLSDSEKVKSPSPAAGLAYFVQIASVYFFTVLLKSAPEWHAEGSALYYALSLEQLRLPAGDVLYQYPQLMEFLSRLVYFIEILIPVLILLPVRSSLPRLFAFVLILILHTAIGLAMFVGLFFLISIGTATGLIPQHIFNSSKSPAAITREKNSVFYFKELFIVLCLFICVVINISSLPAVPFRLHHSLNTFTGFLRLDQNWSMFAPGILKTDGWFVYQGIDHNNKVWDLYKNAPGEGEEKPERIVNMYKNDRWRKLAENIQSDRYTFLRPVYASFLLRAWNKKHPEHPMKTLNLYFIEKTNLPNYQFSYEKKLIYCATDAG